ncbi:hypothetical protein QCA50_005472 [Cerrena zonata]|uniref:Enoyl reductase (ER) domain-containing protein n=1 Tax=Cerrena zonata TaxID=2478898 RepID=A0AAW0GQ69_9APHY
MSTHPQKYTAYAFLEVGGNLQKIDVEWKDPKEGEVIVKVLACGVCGSDDVVQQQAVPAGLPRIPGHEVVGDIVAVHSSETRYKVGDRVGAGWHGGHCFTCDECLEGEFALCGKQEINGVMRDGGYAEYVNLRSISLCHVPKELDPAEAAPLLCAGITAFNSLRNMETSVGDLVAVEGIGGVGHLAIQYAKAMGFRTVAISSSDAKKSFAQDLGASHYINASEGSLAKALQELGGAKVVMCTAPNAKLIEDALFGLKAKGQLLLLALDRGAITVPVVPMVAKRISVRGWATGNPKDNADCLNFSMQTGIKCLIEKFPLEKAQEAYDHRASARFRAVIVP